MATVLVTLVSMVTPRHLAHSGLAGRILIFMTRDDGVTSDILTSHCSGSMQYLSRPTRWQVWAAEAQRRLL